MGGVKITIGSLGLSFPQDIDNNNRKQEAAGV
jgi:hypothetical protein